MCPGVFLSQRPRGYAACAAAVMVANSEGFEPPSSVLETDILPLNEPSAGAKEWTRTTIAEIFSLPLYLWSYRGMSSELCLLNRHIFCSCLVPREGIEPPQARFVASPPAPLAGMKKLNRVLLLPKSI